VTPLNFLATASNNGTRAWLFVAPNNGTTPSALTVLIDPAGLTPGTYSGTVTVSSGVTSGSSTGTTPSLPSPFSVPVTLTVRAPSGASGASGTSGASGASGASGTR
jgi:hypothetical protein